MLTLRPKYRKLHSLNSKPKPSSTEVCFGTAVVVFGGEVAVPAAGNLAIFGSTRRMHPTETPQTLKKTGDLGL